MVNDGRHLTLSTDEGGQRAWEANGQVGAVKIRSHGMGCDDPDVD
jgi:hypothetical protein